MNVNQLIDELRTADYFADIEIAYALLGAMDTSSPLLIEGDPGVGKSSLAVALAEAENIPLIRVQCYEGISPESILYDYDYQRQLLVVSAIRDKLNAAMCSMSVDESIRYVAGNVAFYGKDFLLKRPILNALTMPGRKVLLIDEIDKASEEIEHTLLEMLGDFAITIPEMGETVKCAPENRPIVILTSNKYRDLSAAMKRRCVYLYVRSKSAAEITEILRAKVSDNEEFCTRCAKYLFQIGRLELNHAASISEGIAWAKFLKTTYNEDWDAIGENINYTVGFLAKDNADRHTILQNVFSDFIPSKKYGELYDDERFSMSTL